MDSKDLSVWLLLLMLTLTSVAASEYFAGLLVPALLVITAIKFLGVGFQFMRLKEAHVFWKAGLMLFLAIYVVLVWVLG